MDRRSFMTAAGGALAGLSATVALAKEAAPAPAGGRFAIGMLIFDRMTNLDFVGPCDVFARVQQAKVHVLAKTREPIATDSNHRVLADMTLAEAPKLDLLFVPGGPGTTALMEDAEVLDFLRTRGGDAQWITSVCTGALVIGAAGLLRGYRAATHWSAMDILPTLGATPVDARVVIDRNRVTGGGVTAGIDFALTVVAKLWGDDLARMIQLGQEYNPQPPFDAGSPKTAPEAIVARYRTMLAPQTAARAAAARRAAARFG